KLAAAVTLLAPFVPLLFMGEEYGETAPFLYFISHGDSELIEAVRRGRASDFASFVQPGDRPVELPDPQSESTFMASKLQPQLARQEPHRTLRHFYRDLLRFRKTRRLGK